MNGFPPDHADPSAELFNLLRQAPNPTPPERGPEPPPLPTCPTCGGSVQVRQEDEATVYMSVTEEEIASRILGMAEEMCQRLPLPPLYAVARLEPLREGQPETSSLKMRYDWLPPDYVKGLFDAFAQQWRTSRAWSALYWAENGRQAAQEQTLKAQQEEAATWHAHLTQAVTEVHGVPPFADRHARWLTTWIPQSPSVVGWASLVWRLLADRMASDRREERRRDYTEGLRALLSRVVTETTPASSDSSPLSQELREDITQALQSSAW